MDSTEVRWVIDSHLLGRVLPTGRPTLADALRERGNEVCLASWVPGSRDPDPAVPAWDGACVVAYGSHQFVKQVTRARAGLWQPGAFHRCDRLSYSVFSAHYGDLMLNDGFVLLPYGEFRRRGLAPWGGRAFLRPDAVTKSFTGFVVEEEDFAREADALERLSSVGPEDVVVVAPARPIMGEFRFVIADREVVTGSAYGWGGVQDVRADVHPACAELAREVAARPWQPDRVYVCDVALVDDGRNGVPRLLELNAFSCSGLYACDTRAVAERVSAAAAAEHAGLDMPEPAGAFRA